MKKYFTLFTIGLLNIIHGLTHLIQFIQSVFLASYSLSGEESAIHKFFENPWMGLVWSIIGIITLVMGYKDFKHHREHTCESHEKRKLI
jgi:hypothetical protein